MGTHSIEGLVFAASVIAIGAILLTLVIAPRPGKIEAMTLLPETLNALRAVLFPASGQLRIIQSSEMTYTVRVPCRTGWFWRGGVPIKGTLFYAPVPLGFVARLPNEDALTNRRHIDASALCLVKELAAGNSEVDKRGVGHCTIELLQRCRRWRILIDGEGDTGINTAAGVAIRAHIAVHTSICIEIGDDQAAEVFRDYDNYVATVQSKALESLRKCASKSEYAKLVTHTEEILDDLNDSWQASSDFPNFTTRFTGVVLTLYREQEETRLQMVYGAKVYHPEDKLKEIKLRIDTWKQLVASRLNNPREALQNALSELVSLPSRNALDIENYALQVMNFSGNDEQFKQLVNRSLAAQLSFQNISNEIKKAAQELCSSIAELRQQSESLQDAVRRG